MHFHIYNFVLCALLSAHATLFAFKHLINVAVINELCAKQRCLFFRIFPWSAIVVIMTKVKM